jgi:hypothetical protein
MLQNDPLRLLPIHFNADPDPDSTFHVGVDPDPQHCFYEAFNPPEANIQLLKV